MVIAIAQVGCELVKVTEIGFADFTPAREIATSFDRIPLGTAREVASRLLPVVASSPKRPSASDLIGTRARAARERLGLNQADVAEKVGIGPDVYGRLERGLNTPRVATLLRLCEVLRVRSNDLLLDDQVAELGDKLTPDLRGLITLLEDADPTTIRRVTEVARWLRPRPVKKKQRGRAGTRTR